MVYKVDGNPQLDTYDLLNIFLTQPSYKHRPPINAAFGKGKVKYTPPFNKRRPLINTASWNAQMRR